MNQINDLLKNVDRPQIIKGTAIYLLVYGLLNVCGGIVFSLLGAFSATMGAVSSGAFNDSNLEGSRELADASSALAVSGGMLVVLGILSLISMPFLLGAAFGLFQRKSWARMATVIALIISIVLSLFTLGNGITSIFWIIASGFGVYFFLTDEEIKSILVN